MHDDLALKRENASIHFFSPPARLGWKKKLATLQQSGGEPNSAWRTRIYALGGKEIFCCWLVSHRAHMLASTLPAAACAAPGSFSSFSPRPSQRAHKKSNQIFWWWADAGRGLYSLGARNAAAFGAKINAGLDNYVTWTRCKRKRLERTTQRHFWDFPLAHTGAWIMQNSHFRAHKLFFAHKNSKNFFKNGIQLRIC